jgi:hypothetical protein
MTLAIESSVRPWPGDLEWGGDWLASAASDLEHLGFELRDGSRPGTIPGPRLLVAFRAAPTLEHFDPEEATYWVCDGAHCHRTSVSAGTPGPATRRFAWGRIEVADRIPVANEFLSFGGTLLTGVGPDHTLLAAFTSRAPIVRCAGHSQGIDPLADEMGAFFARLMVPVDYREGAEERIAGSDPEALYAAFLARTARRLTPTSRLRRSNPSFVTTVEHGCRRLEHDVPAAWAAGQELLDWLELE